MWNRKAAFSSLAIAALALAAACTDVPPTQPLATSPEFDAGAVFSRAPADAQPRSRDAQFAEMAREIPGFGGLFFDEAGNLNLYMAPVGGQAMAAAEVASALRGRLQNLGIEAAALQQAIAREGRYDFAQLHDWHQRLHPVLALPGVVLTDVDESRNRLQVGIEEGTSAAAIEQAIARLGVPREAVAVFETAPITLPAGDAITLPAGDAITLRDRVRPVAGGLQIIGPHRPVPGFVFWCTLGFNVRTPTLFPRQDFFFTNSHSPCTEVMGEVTGTQYHQQEITFPPRPADLIGIEVWDPPFLPLPGCPEGQLCRWSDAAIAHYRIPRRQVAFGRIMSPLLGTIVLPSPTSHLRIVGELPFPVLGQLLYKVGRTTGATGGVVDVTCATVNLFGTNITYFCQDRVMGAAAASGDSGAPVVQRVDATGRVRLAGLLWGISTATSDVFVFSAMENIRVDIPGGWITH